MNSNTDFGSAPLLRGFIFILGRFQCEHFHEVNVGAC